MSHVDKRCDPVRKVSTIVTLSITVAVISLDVLVSSLQFNTLTVFVTNCHERPGFPLEISPLWKSIPTPVSRSDCLLASITANYGAVQLLLAAVGAATAARAGATLLGVISDLQSRSLHLYVLVSQHSSANTHRGNSITESLHLYVLVSQHSSANTHRGTESELTQIIG